MALSCFDDRTSRPGSVELEKALGASSVHWLALVDHMKREYPPIVEEWAFAGARFGWSLRLVRKGRKLLYLIPQESSFLVGVVLGDRAFSAAVASELPGSVIDELKATKKCAEGRGIRVKVASARDLAAVKLLAAFKAEY